MNVDFVLMERNRETAAIIFKLRQDPIAQSVSFSKLEDSLEAFYSKFLNNYFYFSDLPSLLVSVDGKKIGYVSFRPYPNPYAESKAAEISICIDPQYRGKKIGSIVLKKINEIAFSNGYEALYACIKKDNITSKKTFENAGYQFLMSTKYPSDIAGNEGGVEIDLYCSHLHSPKKKVFIIAEAGSNWKVGDSTKDLVQIKTLVAAAKKSGCDAIKFQLFRPETVYAKGAGAADYLKDAEGGGDIEMLFRNLSLPYEMIPLIADICKENEIEFLSSTFSAADFAVIDPFVKRHKIASYENCHPALLECAARSKKPLLLSTGASTVSDIRWAINSIFSISAIPITLLQCTAKYPASMQSMNLQTIQWMKSYFKLPVGLSDHSMDPVVAPAAAVALGATVIEKHFTLDRRLKGPDHKFSLVPDELHQMVRAIRNTELALGEGYKRVFPEEEELYQFAKRAIQATTNIAKGDLLQVGKNIDYLRPGKRKRGGHPSLMALITGKRANKAIGVGDGIAIEDVENR